MCQNKVIFLALISSILWISCSKKIALVDQAPANNYTQEIHNFRLKDKKAKTVGPRAPLTETSYKKVTHFEIDPALKVTGDFSLTVESKPFAMSTYSGETREYRSYGMVKLNVNGQPIELAIYQGLQTIRMPQYRDHLFLPFKDLTNDESSYGGGRYIDLVLSDIVDGKLTVDFNKAYAPYCAYADGYSCPIPPFENHLDLAIEAGEKKYPK